MSTLNRLTAARDELNRQILAEATGNLAATIVAYAHADLAHAGRPDVRIDRVAVQVDTEDHHQSAYPFAWVRLGTTSDVSDDVRNVIDDVGAGLQEHFLEWEEYHDWMDVRLAIDDRVDLAGRTFDLTGHLPVTAATGRLDANLALIAAEFDATARQVVGLAWTTIGVGGAPVHLEVDISHRGSVATDWLYVDQVDTQVRDAIADLVDLLWPAGTDPDEHGEGGRVTWLWAPDSRSPGPTALLDDAEAATLIWLHGPGQVEVADDAGRFQLPGGGLGNPGCDGCGTADAAAKVAGRYLCAAEVRTSIDGLHRCVDCGRPQRVGPDRRCVRCEDDRHCGECGTAEPSDGMADAPGPWHDTGCSLHVEVCPRCTAELSADETRHVTGDGVAHRRCVTAEVDRFDADHTPLDPTSIVDSDVTDQCDRCLLDCATLRRARSRTGGNIYLCGACADELDRRCGDCGAVTPVGYPSPYGPHHDPDCRRHGPAPHLSAGSFAACEPDGSVNERFVDYDEAAAAVDDPAEICWVPEPAIDQPDAHRGVPDLSGLSPALRKAAIGAVRQLTGMRPAAAANVVDGRQTPGRHPNEVVTVLQSFGAGEASGPAVGLLLSSLVDGPVRFRTETVSWGGFTAHVGQWSAVDVDGAAALVTGLPDRCPDPWRVARALARLQVA